MARTSPRTLPTAPPPLPRSGAFKEKRRILNVQGKIDDIVGKKTLAALDAEMLAQEAGGGGKLRLGFKVDGEPTIADVVVKFQGAFEEGVLTPDSVLSGRRIFVYKPKSDSAVRQCGDGEP